ncbi:rhamnogalacturonan lyase [Neobacillus sp. 179-C4.2 HS]|uniref:Rhamnogalacturonan lyase n=1 Tax=Neobacillus driksii TaxID=3035913 RepID=A0ABV4YX59_9BACI|nr:rhamnogalacturonan lyase [Neobacillus sp. 179.-C4.2 HS]MDP5192580.1 rhamnogalacturonan lyase [Neobacillus sp. 179.-C4.2 HS]
MKKRLLSKKALSTAIVIPLLLSGVSGVSAGEFQKNNVTSNLPGIQLEYLERGLVAAPTSQGIFLSWRLLANEVKGYSETGLTGVNFNVYRDGKQIATVEDSTNFVDKEGNSDSRYYVRSVLNGKELDQSASISPWKQSYVDLKLQKPADGVTPAGENYTYSANDMSVGDVDGDGQYEYFVKWDPSNSKDVSQKGYTGNTYIDCYKFDGTLLYRIDLGVNIRSGAHYTQFLVYDFDGDGKSEIMFKTAPGTKVIKFDKAGNITSEKYITMPQKDIDAGYSNQDDYRMSREDYYNHVVKMFMGWSEHEEVIKGNWPSTLEEAFGIEKQYTYPLSKEDAESLTDYFMDVYAPKRSGNNKLREFEGFILEGPEYLTVFNGETGEEMDTIDYKPGRHDDGLMWGDYAMARIEPGNRVDRYLANVAYLDGDKPYAVFARGYYTRANLVTYSWDGKELKENWAVDSGWTPMTNPFNDGPHGRDGTDPEYGTLTTQGAHSLSAADVDGDGKQEIVYGSATIDDDGSLLYSSMDKMPEQSAAPGTTARLGHGDAVHVTDIDPSRPGMEIFMVHEGAAWAPYGYSLRDAKTGKIIYGGYTGKDTGRGMVGDVDPSKPGLETWAVGLWTAAGERISTSAPGTNMNIKWAADMTTQIVNGSGNGTTTIDDWKKGRVLTATDTRTNNGTKGNPSLVADIFGDWREELLVRTADSSAIRIYTSTEVTNHKLYTLMHDAQYRAEVARQSTAYNQPSYTSFYFGSDTNWANVPVPSFSTPGVLSVLEEAISQYQANGELTGPLVPKLENSLRQAEHHLEKGSVVQALKFIEEYQSEINHSRNAGNISENARLNLSHKAELLIGMWERMNE